MAKFKQGHRELSIDTPLGSDVLLLTKFTGTEALSAPFEYELEMLSEKPDINFSDILGKNVSVSLSAKAGALSTASSVRYFNGYISRFEQTHSEGNIYHYSAVMVPWLWFLTRRRDCRIFQKLTVPQIVQQIFSDLGFSSVVDNALTATYRTWDYCVQYRETDFDFVSRLLENEGIYYFFKHEKDAQSGNITHKLVLADGVSASVNINGDANISYLGPNRAAKGEYIRDWRMQQTLQSGNFMLNDYDFTAPKKSLLASAANTAGVVSQTDHRVYDYPGGYTQSSDGSNYVQARMQEQQAGFAVASASSNNHGVEAGYLFTLVDHPVSAMNQTYLIRSVKYDIRNENYLQDQPGPVDTTFTCNLTCFESSQQFRPARSTPKALVRGPQTAVVVGPAGEKIYTDEYGRVKVQFYWDTYGTSDQNSSCWIRVSQSWAGSPTNGISWGDMAIPHVGDEVIVDFLEGDPDCPLITGRVYNADNMPPQDLPDNKHKRIMRDDYGNQIILDATPGDEHIRISSPHHYSDLQLGRSVTWNTQSNAYQCTYGNNWSGTVGTSGNMVLGSEIALAAGGYVNAKAGFAYNVTLGAQYNLTAGYKCEADWSETINWHGGDTDTIGKEDMTITTGETLWLIGGDQGANAASTATAIANLSSKGIDLEIGPPKSITPQGLGAGMKVVQALAIAFPIAGAALLAAGAAEGTPPDSSTFLAGMRGSATGTDPQSNWLDDTGLAAYGIGLVASVAFWIWLKIAKDSLKASAHGGAAAASLKFDPQGNVTMESDNGKIDIKSKAGSSYIKFTPAGHIITNAPNGNASLMGNQVKINGTSGVKINGQAILVEP
jgi:type VI secretion system secreted protein VgrG